jgi:hypothetical protein
MRIVKQPHDVDTDHDNADIASPGDCINWELPGSNTPSQRCSMTTVVVQTGEEPPPAFSRSVYLAHAFASWDQEAIRLLGQCEFANAAVFIGNMDESETACSWRQRAMSMSDAILFW